MKKTLVIIVVALSIITFMQSLVISGDSREMKILKQEKEDLKHDIEMLEIDLHIAREFEDLYYDRVIDWENFSEKELGGRTPYNGK